MNNIQPTPSINKHRSILRYPLGVLMLCCTLLVIQCKKTSVTTSSSAKLTFTTNKLFFDTVFTTVGSTVRYFVVHNNNNQAVSISSINLAGNYPTFFKINVDGIASSALSNVQIPANDSIYVFATLTVDPDNKQNPALIQDSLVFTTNGNVQSVELQGYGWDAYFYMPNVFPPTGPAYSIVKCGDVWMNDKPHVIFGYLVVDSGCTLHIDQGAGVYLHDSAVLYVSAFATLNVAGTASQPVTFQQDRLEPDYNYLPGQWNEIWLTPGSRNNTVSWAVIQNGQTGFDVDTVYSNQPTLTMDHTIIKSMSAYGVFAEGAQITANDCLIADCQYSCLFLYIGGTYQFNQCTFADYWGVYNGYSNRTTPLLYLNNNYLSEFNQQEPRGLTARFGNCIIYGALDEEVSLDSNYGASFNYYFENCVIKTKQNTSVGFHYNDSIYTADPLFNDLATDNYIVNGGSPALGNANPGIAQTYTLSLDDKPRPANGLTIGAYEQ